MNDGARRPVVRIGDVHLDVMGGTLRRNGELVTLRAKSFHLLCVLAESAERVVARSDLIDAVWGDVAVTDDSLTQAVRDVRRAIGDPEGRILRTVARRGFLLTLAAPEERVEPQAPALSAPAAPPEEPFARIEVRPFERAGPVEGGETLDEDLAAALARFRSFVVLAPRAASSATNRPGFVVDGIVRPRDGAPHLTVSLSEAASGALLWSDRFALPVTGDGLAPIASRLSRRIEEAMLRAAMRRPDGELGALGHLVRGRAFFRSYERGMNERARGHFAAAMAADPGLGLARSLHAIATVAVNGYGLAPADILAFARSEAALGADLSPEESRCHGILSYLLVLVREFDTAERAAARGVAINPADADTAFDMGFVQLVRGRPDACLEWIDRAAALDPWHPVYYDDTRARALFDLGRVEEAARLLLQLPRRDARGEFRLAAALGRLGDREGAAAHLRAGRAAAGGIDLLAEAPGAWPYERASDLARLVKAIEEAGRLAGG